MPAPSASGRSRRRPVCDADEAAVWENLDGVWEPLHGCYCREALSIEWHDFTCETPHDWARSLHERSLELCLNLSGQGRMTCGRKVVLFGPGTAGMYVESPVLSAWREPGQRHQFLTVEMGADFLERHLPASRDGLHPLAGRLVASDSAAPCIAPVIRMSPDLRRLVEVLRHPPVEGPARLLWYRSKALELMATFLFPTLGAAPAAGHRRQHVARERVERAIETLSRHLADPPSLTQLSREVGCSPYYLSRTFSREMGMTIPQYLRQIRMERAAELLRSGRFNVTEVALEVGYSSLSHFSLAFRETIGACPGLYPVAPLHLGITSATRR